MNIIMFVVSTYILIRINHKISLILFILVPIYITMYFIFKNKLYKLNYEYTEAQNMFFSEMNMQLDNIKIVKINVLFNILNNRLNNSFNVLYKKGIKSFKSNISFSNIGVLTSVTANIIIWYWGITEIINNNLTLGQFTILTLYFSNIMGSIKYFLSFSSQYQNIKASYERINEWVSIDKEQNDSESIKSLNEINLTNISFGYSNDRLLYEDFNYLFSKGYIYHIKGSNGSGKSSLINIIIGLYNSQYEGCVEFNNISINTLDMYSVRDKLIGVTEQEPILLEDTILNNITYNLESINQDEINKFINILNLQSFIEKLPQGIESNILTKNYNLSGGEKQKISLLRTFIKSPDLIILDEATSALDKDTVNNLKLYIESIKKDKIIIIIDHNDSFKDTIDFIIDLDEEKTKKKLDKPMITV